MLNSSSCVSKLLFIPALCIPERAVTQKRLRRTKLIVYDHPEARQDAHTNVHRQFPKRLFKNTWNPDNEKCSIQSSQREDFYAKIWSLSWTAQGWLMLLWDFHRGFYYRFDGPTLPLIRRFITNALFFLTWAISSLKFAGMSAHWLHSSGAGRPPSPPGAVSNALSHSLLCPWASHRVLYFPKPFRRHEDDCRGVRVRFFERRWVCLRRQRLHQKLTFSTRQQGLILQVGTNLSWSFPHRLAVQHDWSDWGMWSALRGLKASCIPARSSARRLESTCGTVPSATCRANSFVRPWQPCNPCYQAINWP